MNVKSLVLGGLAVALALARPATADPASCRKVTFGQPPWTDIATTDGMAITFLDALGYQPQAETLSVPVIFQALANGQIDAFQGNWMPAQSKFATPLIDQKGRPGGGEPYRGQIHARGAGQCGRSRGEERGGPAAFRGPV
jgi:ABC-type proline/glycine betaine transport system substrate-binding protein